MPQYGAHAFVWIDQWKTEKGNRAIAAAAQQGFDFIEIPLLKPEEFDAPAHKQALEQAGTWATASLVLPKDAHMPAHPERAKACLIHALDQVHAFGGNYLCGCLAFAIGTLTGAPPTRAEVRIHISTEEHIAISGAEKRAARRSTTARRAAAPRRRTPLSRKPTHAR